jgi:DNA-directed RNA polymerase specialized sigma24 family protein
MSENTIRFLTAYESFVHEIFLFFCSRIREREIAKRLTQETFMKTWNEISAVEAKSAQTYGLRSIHKILRRNAEILITNQNLSFAM